MQNILSLLHFPFKISDLDQILFSCDQKTTLGCFLAVPVTQIGTDRKQESSPLVLADLTLSTVLKPEMLGKELNVVPSKIMTALLLLKTKPNHCAQKWKQWNSSALAEQICFISNIS